MPVNSLKCAGSAQFSYVFLYPSHTYASAQEAKEHIYATLWIFTFENIPPKTSLEVDVAVIFAFI